MLERYVPLWTKTNGSFLEGASHPEEMVEQAHRLGLPAVAITDRDGLYSLPKAHLHGQELGVQVLAGAEVQTRDAGPVVLLAMDREGYGNLCGLLTRGRLRVPKGLCDLGLDDVCGQAAGLLALWPGKPAEPLPAPAMARAPRRMHTAEAALPPRDTMARLRDAFGDRIHGLLARHKQQHEPEREARLRDAAGHVGASLVAGHEVLYHAPDRRPLQDVLTCIRHGVTVHTAGDLTRPNAEHALKNHRAFCRLFEDEPALVARTREVAERCGFTLDQLRYRYPDERLPDGNASTHEWLRELTWQGAKQRFGAPVPPRLAQQIEKELTLIGELQYGGYFLTMREIVRYCREQGILCQGRGSAANSVVCYCLGITAVDPTRIELLFERFLSKERREPPDIDLDIEHQRREEVIQHVYHRYGRSHAGMVANVIRFRPKSAVRQVGKALGLPETAMDRLARQVTRGAPDWQELLKVVGLDPEAPIHQHLVQLVEEIQDTPRHLSIHPGGFLLGADPVDSIVPIENGAMDHRTVIQWDKDDLENLGLFKVDLLGLGALSLVRRSLDLLREHRGVDLELSSIPAEDPATYDMCCTGDTVGVFQIESRAQMAMLPRLKPRTFYDLVVEISIVRPGPIAGDMLHPYLRRRSGEEPVTYAHPSLEPVLAKTLGVPLFQEQVIRLAMVAADYTPGEADQLRRDMAAWRRSGRIERHRERLVARMMQKGIAQDFAERVFEQIRGFGEYGFPESHAASFALIAYATAWLKCHHPEVFACALLNAWPMGFYSPATIVEDARRHGVEVRPMDVLHSDVDCSLEGDGSDPAPLAIRMGLRYVKGLPAGAAERVCAERRQRPFDGLKDFVYRTDLSRDQLEVLAEGGALRGLDGPAGEASRRQTLWDVWRLAGEDRNGPPRLPLESAEPTPELAPLDPLEEVAWDYRAGAHSTRGHPLEPLREELTRLGLPDADGVNAKADGERVRYAGLVICRQRPGTAKGVTFFTLEDETGFVNVVCWRKVFDQQAPLLRTARFLGVLGKVQRQDGILHVIAQRFFEPELRAQPESAGSRDYH